MGKHPVDDDGFGNADSGTGTCDAGTFSNSPSKVEFSLLLSAKLACILLFMWLRKADSTIEEISIFFKHNKHFATLELLQSLPIHVEYLGL
jgi:hypothetical protein